MKTLSPALAAHVAQGLTTLCHCWRVVRKDGTVMGFTDHDQNLTFDGGAYQAASGFSATQIEDQLGLAVSNLEVAGALSTDALTEADMVGGRYDDAEITLYRVNWADPSQRTVMRKGWIGQVTRSVVAFQAELRGLAAPLDQSAGRLFQRTCAWNLGDSRCRVDLTLPGRRGAGAVTQVIDALDLAVSGLADFPAGVFDRGKLVWTSGANSGLAVELRGHLLSGGVARLTLMLPMGADVQVGDAFTVAWGCDNTITTCHDRFDNVANYGGFPHMPGNDFTLSVASQGGANDGSAIVAPAVSS